MTWIISLSNSYVRRFSSWTQPPSRSVSPGGTVTITCTTTQSSYSIHWYQQKAGQAPRFVHCDGCSSRGEGIPNRFTATRSGSTGSLTITNVQAEDEADYYCGSWNSGATELHCGKFLWGCVTKTFSLSLHTQTKRNTPSCKPSFSPGRSNTIC
uniref:Ig-like domain-containing protein n=1 Tax=Laticauda laticaudata TaxID=8630 RepID=A0A8C5S825_LATLA